ncbi:MAG: ATP-binding cassette domain-containing protein [Clostridia bacterium]|nr:ATP-binding cassette domain-containing protein [Clostridia bacterium]
MLQLQNVRKTYKTKAGIVNALDGVSLTFPSSGLVFITGKSGCGKTTLLNVIGGLDGIDEGEILVQDKKFSTFSATEYDSYRNTFIGFIFQEYNLLPEFTVEKNIKIAMELQGRKADDAEFEKLLKDVEIDELKVRNPSELSGGQRQRVAIARALVKQPRIIMADEPTGALDSGTGIQVLDTLKKLSKDKLVIVVSHDREFAERYADRIIHLVDGKVAQDVTFTEKEIVSNVSEQENTLVVREGAELTESEKDALAKAVKERKKIEVIENLCYRDKEPTGNVTHSTDKPVSLRNSQMKLKSAAYLGVKSLAVKPVRLILTILISALAFAVFALFDTIANFSTPNVLKNQLKTSLSSTLVAYSDYVVDYDAGDRYTVKVSENTVAELQSKTGGTVKGIFDLRDNTTGSVQQSLSISELLSSDVVVGKKYYANTVNGFIEFEKGKEISENGKFTDFDYKLVYGEYPELLYENGVLVRESAYQIAISTYLADSIIYYLNGSPLHEKQILSYEDMLGASITVNQQQYTVVGLIDCGEIPEKYDLLRQSTPYNVKTNALLSDFNAYIDSGAQKCLFVAKDFLQIAKEESHSADIFHVGNATWTLSAENVSARKQVTEYLYNAEDYDADNILLFDGEYPQDNKITLADDEILIHPLNLENLFAANITALTDSTDRSYVKSLIGSMQTGTVESNRATLTKVLTLLNVNISDDAIKAAIHQRFTETGAKLDKDVKIVGVYFGIATDSYTSYSRYKLMMNKNLMRDLSVFAEQGDYNKLLFSARSIQIGGNVIVNYLMNESGLTLHWYNNSVLNVIRSNETMIRQVADLFLYAALALALFSVFMLYNYMSTSIASKKQSVGVLRGLGAGGKDVLITFLSESLIVSVINGILANVFAVIGCALVNAYIVEIMNISIHFALFGVRQVLIIAAISLLTAIASSAIPIVKISKKKPVELIRRP